MRANFDSEISSLVTILQLRGSPTDANQLQHNTGCTRFSVTEIVRSAREYALKAMFRATITDRRPHQAPPAIVRRTAGSVVMLTKIIEDAALLHDSMKSRPSLMTMAELVARRWRGIREIRSAT
ncbi:hypothetical protein [Methylobacterium sp. 77]|uniref:hypothetical protein n=1 Tax=Methylobacterium sp. 77 TaxID=1101192 RepID=UPI0012DFA65D|nr:hypothetical protein [Methylobacterium sp. 77]